MQGRLGRVVVPLIGLALVLGACSGSDDDAGAASTSPGAAVFAANCASCHGVRGAGGQGPAIGDGKAAAKYSETAMRALVSGGRNSMPAFGGRLTATQLDDVVAFVRDDLGRDGAGTTTTTEARGRGSLTGVPPEIADAADDDWPLPNHDYAGTRAASKPAITSKTVDRLELAWSYEAPGGGTFGNFSTTPLVIGNTIYVGDLTTQVHAIDRRTGKQRWVSGKKASIFGPTGVGAGWGRIYGTTANADGKGTVVAAYDAKTGKQAWSTDIGGNGSDINNTPVAYDGLVIVSTSGYGTGSRATIYALDAETGSIVWDFPVIADKGLWGHPELNSGGGVWYPPTIDVERGIAYIGTGNPYPFPGAKGFPNGSSRPGDNKWTDSTLALDVHTGKLVWGNQAIAHDIFDRDAMLTSRLDVRIGGRKRAVTISSGKFGVVRALDADTGKQLWSTKVGTHLNDDLTKIDGPTKVYPGSLGGVETPLATADGTVYASVVNAPTEYQDPEETSYGFGVQLGSDDSEFVAIDAATGKVRWTTTLDGDSFGGATVSGDLVFTSTFGGEILALRRDTGKIVWRYRAPGGINGWPAVAGDELIVPVGTSNPPQILAFHLGEG